MNACRLCPRECGIDRSRTLGFCGQPKEIQIAKATLHFFEEPPISGTRGSGTVFFCGCSLRCEFCQNKKISRATSEGRTLSPAELAEVLFDLEAQGAHNINLVTPTHFSDGVREALILAKPRLSIPVVYNTSGYERVEILRSLEGLVDIYLPDFKYCSPELAEKYSSAPDYREVAEAALVEMFRQTGAYEFDADGLLLRGVMVRHLVLPSARHDSIAVLDRLAALLPVDDVLLSLMSQYTPEFALDSPHRELHRRLTAFEYDSVLAHAEKLGFLGFMQGRTSSSTKYTPDF
ncbi:MAG: radical SAM protein [Clostridia bacterium]|nr:radical SAM protein [Clostridia bacterium]